MSTEATRPKAIVYSLFGYDRVRQENCFDFNSYLRGLMINLRMNRLLFPDWTICLQTDQATYEAWGGLFKRLPIKVEIHQNGVPLTLAMLWRLRPIFDNVNGIWMYSHVLCRDLDSPPTYREAQAVQYWINRDKAAHAITDSVSHDVPMLGGMIGFRPDYITERLGAKTWRDLINKGSGYDWNRKGTDQRFLTEVVYPCVAQHGNDSITQHYVLGMPNSFLSDCHSSIQDMDLGELAQYKDSNSVCGHIGAAGYYEGAMFKFLRNHWDKFSDLLEIEKEYPNIFYWTS